MFDKPRRADDFNRFPPRREREYRASDKRLIILYVRSRPPWVEVRGSIDERVVQRGAEEMRYIGRDGCLLQLEDEEEEDERGCVSFFGRRLFIAVAVERYTDKGCVSSLFVA